MDKRNFYTLQYGSEWFGIYLYWWLERVGRLGGRSWVGGTATYLVHPGESQMASPVFQCGPPEAIPQQIGDAGVVAGVSLVTHDTRCAAVHSLQLGLVLLEVWVPDG